MLNELIYGSIESKLITLEEHALEKSRPFQIVVSNLSPAMPTSHKISIFDGASRFSANYNLPVGFRIEMPLLRFKYGAFLEEIQNNPITIGKIRFEALGAYNGVPTAARIQDFGAMIKNNFGNTGEGVSESLDQEVFVNQTLPNTIDWYGEFTTNGLTELQFIFPAKTGALRMTFYRSREMNLTEKLLTGKLFKQYAKVPINILPAQEMNTSILGNTY